MTGIKREFLSGKTSTGMKLEIFSYLMEWERNKEKQMVPLSST